MKIEVGKPHISLSIGCIRLGGPNRAMYRCMGPFQSAQYGRTPAEAYNAWAKAMTMRHQFIHNRRR